MVNRIKKAVEKISEKVSGFINKNLSRIIIVGGIFIFLEISKSFPYVNIIPSIDFLIIGFTLLLAVVLFRVTIPNKGIVFVVLFFLIIAALATIVDLKDIAEMIGFIVFVLISLIIIRQIFQDRKKLKEASFEQ